jgi:signal peptidase I
MQGNRTTRRWLETAWRSGRRDLVTWLEVEGGSMSPALRPGDRILVAPFAGEAPPGTGEIVVALRSDRLVSHRLVGHQGTLAITRGDACRSDDPPLPMDHLLGRVVRVRRAGHAALVRRRIGRVIQRIRRSL